MASGFRPEFEQALRLIGEAFSDFKAQGKSPPIIVGGAAVEFYTGSTIMTGDFDLVSPDQPAIEAALQKVGFRREDRMGHAMRGLYHPDLNMGAEVVSSRLLDGAADIGHTVDVTTSPAGAFVRIVSLEDMIADRLAQYGSAPRGVPEMLDQALTLWRFAEQRQIDEAYLDKRIRYETAGDWSLDRLKSQT
jgi:hypothetical protein